MERFIQDLRYGLRGLARSPGFTGVAVATLALGIGAVTSIFTVADAVIFRPPPYADADRLVALNGTDPMETDRDQMSGADYLDLRDLSESFEELAAYRGLSFNLVGADFPRRISGASVTPDFFSLLGVDASLGRVLSPAIDRPAGAPEGGQMEGLPSVVLGQGLWQTQFGGDTAILGQSIRLNHELYSVVGVMPAGFAFPQDCQLWTAARYRVPDPPFDFGGDPAENRRSEYLSVVGRLTDGIDLRVAQSEMHSLARRLAEEYPEVNKDEGIALVPLHEEIAGDAGPQLLLLLGAVAFLLLIACANVANLLLVRASRRQREIGLRMTLGAAPLRIVRLLLTESLLLAAGAGVLGLLFSLWGTEALLAIAPEGIPRIEEIGADPRVLAFTVTVVAGTGFLFGLAPLPQIFRQDLFVATKEGTGGTSFAARSRLRKALIVGEIAVSFVLLVGAGLMIRTLGSVVSVDPGFDPSDTLAMHLTLPDARYQEDSQVIDFYRRMLAEVRALPGVESAATVLTLPMHWNLRGTLRFAVEGRSTDLDQRPVAGYQIVSPDYFRTLRIPLLRGRLLSAADREDAPSVALINEAFAARYWPGEDAVGKRITWNDPQGDDVDWVSVVGVVGNTRLEGLDQPAVAEAYRPFPQAALNFTTLVVRSSISATALRDEVGRVVAEVDPEQPVHGVMTLSEVLAESLAERRFTMLLMTTFAAVALLLAAVGLYGVVSYSVSQRFREIGIRQALGARRPALILQVIREGFALAAAGLVLGAAGGLALTRLITSQVHGVSPTDPVSYVLGVALLVTVALLSCGLPALRASRVDPVVALRGG